MANAMEVHRFYKLSREQIIDYLVNACNYNPAFFDHMSDDVLKAWVLESQYTACLAYNKA